MPSVSRLPSGNWRAQYRDRAGRRHSKTFPGKKQARDWALEMERLVRLGRHRDPRAARMTVGAYEPQWWAARVVEATTEATDRGRLDRHVLAQWADAEMEAITPTAVQGWVKRLVKDGLAAATARSCHQLLASLLASAVSDSIIDVNPARGIRLPTPTPGREVYLTREQVDAVAAVMTGDLDRAVVYTLAYTGLRWGELAGLRVRRLDPLLRSLTVCEVLIEVGGRRQVKPYPKDKQPRSVPIPASLRGVLAAHLAANPAGRDDLVFRPQPVGALSRHTWGRWRFRPAVASALGRTDVHVHDLRHTYASWLVQARVRLPRVQQVLGHASIVTTQRYAHLAPDEHGEVLGAFDVRELGLDDRG